MSTYSEYLNSDDWDLSKFPQDAEKWRYTDRGGYDLERELARRVMKAGDVLTVKNCKVGRSDHQVEFVELPGAWFNGCMFEKVTAE